MWSHSVMPDSLRPHELYPTRLLCPWDSSGKNTGVVCNFLFQGIFPTQRSNPGLLHSRDMLYPLSHQGSPNRMLLMTPHKKRCHLCDWLSSYRLEVSTTLSLGLINLLEWFTELRETFYSVDHWFIMKRYNSGTARWKRHRKQGLRKWLGPPMVS